MRKKSLLVEEIMDGDERLTPVERDATEVKVAEPVIFKTEIALPEFLTVIQEAFESDGLRDIEVELSKEKPNGKMYHLNRVFGDIDKMSLDKRKDIKITKRKLYLVGGAVRDHMLKVFHPHAITRGTKDFNLVTDARPKVTMLILVNNKISAFIKGDEVFAEVNGQQVKIATFRESYDPATGSIVFTSPEKDLLTRDFRANALLYNMQKNQVEDYVGGLSDIRDKKLTPLKSFDKNPINALRGVRIFSKMNSGPLKDEDLLQKLKSTKLNGDKHAIHYEFIKGLKTAENQGEYLNTLNKTGLLHQIFGTLNVLPVNITQNVHPHVAIALTLSNNNPGKIEMVLNRLNFNDKEIKDIVHLVNLKNYHSKEQKELFINNLRFTNLIPTTVRKYVELSGLQNKNLINFFMR